MPMYVQYSSHSSHGEVYLQSTQFTKIKEFLIDVLGFQNASIFIK